MKMQKPKIDLEKVKQGDPDAFRDFFAFLYPKLKALACRFVDEETAEDVDGSGPSGRHQRAQAD